MMTKKNSNKPIISTNVKPRGNAVEYNLIINNNKLTLFNNIKAIQQVKKSSNNVFREHPRHIA
jgi:hypothetical protein